MLIVFLILGFLSFSKSFDFRSEIFVGSFSGKNLNNFNSTFFNTSLVDLVHDFDLLFIPEISDNQVLSNLIEKVNVDNKFYSVNMSIPYGSLSQQYAFIYNTKTIEIKSTYQSPAVQSQYDLYKLPPYGIIVELKELGYEIFFFGFKASSDPTIDISYPQYSYTSMELRNFIKTYEKIRDDDNQSEDFSKEFKNILTNRTILFGDFSCDCSYVSQAQFEHLKDLTDQLDLHWLFTSDTTILKDSYCAYDRAIASGNMKKEFLHSYGVWNVVEKYNWDSSYAQKIFDKNFPIFVTFKYTFWDVFINNPGNLLRLFLTISVIVLVSIFTAITLVVLFVIIVILVFSLSGDRDEKLKKQARNVYIMYRTVTKDGKIIDENEKNVKKKKKRKGKRKKRRKGGKKEKRKKNFILGLCSKKEKKEIPVEDYKPREISVEEEEDMSKRLKRLKNGAEYYESSDDDDEVNVKKTKKKKSIDKEEYERGGSVSTKKKILKFGGIEGAKELKAHIEDQSERISELYKERTVLKNKAYKFESEMEKEKKIRKKKEKDLKESNKRAKKYKKKAIFYKTEVEKGRMEILKLKKSVKFLEELNKKFELFIQNKVGKGSLFLKELKSNQKYENESDFTDTDEDNCKISDDDISDSDSPSKNIDEKDDSDDSDDDFEDPELVFFSSGSGTPSSDSDNE